MLLCSRCLERVLLYGLFHAAVLVLHLYLVVNVFALVLEVPLPVGGCYRTHLIDRVPLLAGHRLRLQAKTPGTSGNTTTTTAGVLLCQY